MCIQVAIISLMIAGCTNEEAKTTDDWIPLLRDNNMVGWYTFIQDYGRDNDPEGIFSLKNGVLHFYPNSQNNSHQSTNGARKNLLRERNHRAIQVYFIMLLKPIGSGPRV
jgi:hypothetical protein